MADPETTEEQTDAQAEAMFEAGFTDAPPAAPAAPTPPPTVVVKTEPAPAPVAKPKYVQFTEEEATRLRSAADETAGLKQQIAKVFGTMGNMQQLINQQKAQTPAGTVVEFTEDDFKEMKEDFPELTRSQVAGLNRALKRGNIRGTGAPAPATASVDMEAVRVAAAEMLHREGMENLTDMHPDWQQVVTSVPYRNWLGRQTAEYQAKIAKSYSADFVGRSIDRFRASQKTAASPPQARPQAQAQPVAPAPTAQRREAIAAAVQPRGNGSAPPPRSPSAQEHFDSGFSG